MFNDLNQPNQPAAQTPPVDDIFAETDKSAEAKTFSGYYANSTATPSTGTPTEIETQKAGLSSAEELPVSSKGKILKVLLIALLIILLIGLGYLVYVKFLTGQNTSEVPVVVNTKPATTSTTVATKTPITNIQATTTQATNTIPVSQETSVVTSTPLATTTPPAADLVDRTKDTDGDGLSDYEEVMIYHSDPLNPDTNGNGYNDGVEVKNGYDPTIAGKKLSDTHKQATSTTSIK